MSPQVVALNWRQTERGLLEPRAGTFSIHVIADEDWKRWNIEPYGPTMKIFLSGWNEIGGEGPIEEANGRVDVFWVIYRVTPPLVQKPGTVWSKFGR